MNQYAKWFSRVVYLGIGVNMIFVVMLMFAPEFLFNLLDMTIPAPIIWARSSALLLLEISIIYVAVAQDPFRYPLVSWMAIVVTRGGGASCFTMAVLFFKSAIGLFNHYFSHRYGVWAAGGRFTLSSTASTKGQLGVQCPWIPSRSEAGNRLGARC